MEKTKNDEKGLNKILFLGEIGPDGWSRDFIATPGQCAKIAERFDIPKLENLHTHIDVSMDRDLVRVSGHITADLEQVCVVSLDKFKSQIDTDFEALFSENVPLIKEGKMEDDVEPIDRGRLDVFEIVAEQIGLNLDPFPRKQNVSGDYIENEKKRNHPFANLKNLIKKD